jgi:hypothetical protein
MRRVLVLTGGLIHLVHQLAVVADLPETRGGGAERLAEQHQVIQAWLGRLAGLVSALVLQC